MNVEPDSLIGIRNALEDVLQEAQRGPRIVSDAYAAFKRDEQAHKVAKARAHQKAKRNTGDGKPTIADIEAEVVLNTITECEAEIAADVAHRYALSRVKELENRRSSLQTNAKLVIEELRLVGTGATP